MNQQYNYLLLLEGITKFNIILLGIAVILLFSEQVSIEQIYRVYKEQFLIILFSVLFGKIYQKIDSYKFFTRKIKIKSLIIGYIIYCLISLLIKFIILHNPITEEIKVTVINLSIGLGYWAIILWLCSSRFMKSIMKFLQGTLDFKHFYQLFIMFNISFFILILIMIAVGMFAGRSIFESIFVIIYVELAFLVFHIFVGKIFDFIWSPETFDQKKVSILGLYIGSTCYVIKIHLIDENLLGISVPKNDMSLFAILALISFWTFFAILFHFEIKYPMTKR